MGAGVFGGSGSGALVDDASAVEVVVSVAVKRAAGVLELHAGKLTVAARAMAMAH